jgi:hypothetical protein
LSPDENNPVELDVPTRKPGVPTTPSGICNVVLATTVVPVTAAGVVAPTVPLMFIEAVPVRLVTTPDAMVPKAVALPEASRLTDFAEG